ncbi:TetR family transcriptional regulator [Oleiphilus messinensis]|uniref:TetR family transcriptional regulator n=1 Tax=Oleiphilus messinensis TaxID=141451 RepID=A0A1Y0IC58_9GAMM|nr:TetR/AcrR family transcriptional regulator [Oleiphilus messinensis]ARU56984.1 TetR family transcriptional regulator [Oleiphilus messinensis]
MTIGRPKQFNPDVALQKATYLFWQKGYEATSTTDLMKAMGLSKSSLYQTFGSKKQLFEQCVAYYGADNVTLLKKMQQEHSSPLQFLIGLFRFAIDPERNPETHLGCMMVNSACELAEVDDFKPKIRYQMDKTHSLIQESVEEAQKIGEITGQLSAKEIADYIFANLCGLRVIGRMNNNQKTLNNIIDMTFSTII